MILRSSMRDMNYEPQVTAVVDFDGKVSWMYSAVLKSTCQLNIDYFPWDQQSCELKFGS